MASFLRTAVFGISAAVVLLSWATPCRADVPPFCSDLDSLITCAQADVGRPCQGGGQCYTMSCGVGEIPQVTAVYKCAACPPILTTTSSGADCSSYSQLQMPCGDGGTCAVLPSYCAPLGPKLACVGPMPAQPTGPPIGEGAGGAGGAVPTGGVGGAVPTGGAGGAVSTGGAGGLGAAGGSSGAGSGATSGASHGGGGCDVVPRVPSAGVIAFALLMVGVVTLIVDRRRRRR